MDQKIVKAKEEALKKSSGYSSVEMELGIIDKESERPELVVMFKSGQEVLSVETIAKYLLNEPQA